MRDNRVRASCGSNQEDKVILSIHISPETFRQPVGVILIIYRAFSCPLALPEEVCCRIERDTIRQFVIDLLRPGFRREPDKLLAGGVRDNLLPVLFGVSDMQFRLVGAVRPILLNNLPPVGFQVYAGKNVRIPDGGSAGFVVIEYCYSRIKNFQLPLSFRRIP